MKNHRHNDEGEYRLQHALTREQSDMHIPTRKRTRPRHSESFFELEDTAHGKEPYARGGKVQPKGRKALHKKQLHGLDEVKGLIRKEEKLHGYATGGGIPFVPSGRPSLKRRDSLILKRGGSTRHHHP